MPDEMHAFRRLKMPNEHSNESAARCTRRRRVRILRFDEVKNLNKNNRQAARASLWVAVLTRAANLPVTLPAVLLAALTAALPTAQRAVLRLALFIATQALWAAVCKQFINNLCERIDDEDAFGRVRMRMAPVRSLCAFRDCLVYSHTTT